MLSSPQLSIILFIVAATLFQQASALQCFVGNSTHYSVEGGFTACLSAKVEGRSVTDLWGKKDGFLPFEGNCVWSTHHFGPNQILMWFTCQCRSSLCNLPTIQPNIQFIMDARRSIGL